MKQELIMYTCDSCGASVTIESKNYSMVKKWLRLYRLQKPTDLEKTKLHFCSDNCTLEYLESVTGNVR